MKLPLWGKRQRDRRERIASGWTMLRVSNLTKHLVERAREIVAFENGVTTDEIPIDELIVRLALEVLAGLGESVDGVISPASTIVDSRDSTAARPTAGDNTHRAAAPLKADR